MKKYLLVTLFLLCTNLFNLSFAATTRLLPVIAKFELLNPDLFLATEFKTARSNKQFYAKITLYNHGGRTIHNWRLGFNFARRLGDDPENHDAFIAGAVSVENFGDYHLIAGTREQKDIYAYGKVEIIFKSLKYGGLVEHYTDAPIGYFLIADNLPLTDVPARTILPARLASRQHRSSQIEGHQDVDSDPQLLASFIVPLPSSITRHPGYFHLSRATTIFYMSLAAKPTADFLADILQDALGFRLAVRYGDGSEVYGDNIVLSLTSNAQSADLKSKEAYKLIVVPNYVSILASDTAGLFYGVQSLRQLLPPQIFSCSKQFGVDWKIAAVTIEDVPRFKYRGMMLDIARHFRTVAEIKRLIDLLSILKFNVFHWHLVDDEGWRVQINKYPELTQIGACRGFNFALKPAFGSSSGAYCGYYTQDEISAIVKYANERHVTVIPEIDMPGHARAMVVSLPSLLIDPSDTSTYTGVQGYHDNVLSPCLESTYSVISDIVQEIAPLFNNQTNDVYGYGKYFHIGSDEVPAHVWDPAKSQNCASLMQREHLTTTSQLQNYFAKRVQAILQNNSYEIAAWDDLSTENRLHPAIMLYVWHWYPNFKVDKVAAKTGYQKFILANAEHLYLDLAYNSDPKEPGYYWVANDYPNPTHYFFDTFQTYSYSPFLTENISTQYQNLIEGVQGQLWGENIISQNRMDYMTFPKLAALAEVAWTPAAKRSWKNFAHRLDARFLPALDNYGVKYRKAK